jgi:putative transcriptional regulator
MSDFGKDLIAAMEEAAAHAQGKGKVARVQTLEVPDVRAIREGLGLSQQAFASAYRIPLATLKGWEQGRRQPDATASAYLSVIAHLPREARGLTVRAGRAESRGYGDCPVGWVQGDVCSGRLSVPRESATI